MAVAVAIAVCCGCGGATVTTGPRQTGTPSVRGLTATLRLDSTAVRTGSLISGTITVENSTGHALHASGCGGIFQVLLTSTSYHPSPTWPACLGPITVPAGTSLYPITVEARYNLCGQGGGLPACVGGETPPLLPGKYEAKAFELGTAVPLPAPVPVFLTG